jgi:hypothetical protein
LRPAFEAKMFRISMLRDALSLKEMGQQYERDLDACDEAKLEQSCMNSVDVLVGIGAVSKLDALEGARAVAWVKRDV